MKGKKKGEVEVNTGQDVSLSTSLGFDHINKVITELGPIWQKIGMKCQKKGAVEVDIGEDVSLSTSLGFDHINNVNHYQLTVTKILY